MPRELRNVGANYPLKGRKDFQGSSRILATETIRVRAATVGDAARAQCQDLGRMLALAGIAARFSADPFPLGRRPLHCRLWGVKSLLRHRSDRPKRRLTTDQMAFVVGRHVALA